GSRGISGRGRWERPARGQQPPPWPRRGTDDDSWGSSQALLSAARGPPRRGRADSSTPLGRWRVVGPSGTLGPSLVDRPIGASSLHQTASPVGLPAAGTGREGGGFKETVHGSKTIRRCPAILDVQRSTARPLRR